LPEKSLRAKVKSLKTPYGLAFLTHIWPRSSNSWARNRKIRPKIREDAAKKRFKKCQQNNKKQTFYQVDFDTLGQTQTHGHKHTNVGQRQTGKVLERDS